MTVEELRDTLNEMMRRRPTIAMSPVIAAETASVDTVWAEPVDEIVDVGQNNVVLVISGLAEATYAAPYADEPDAAQEKAMSQKSDDVCKRCGHPPAWHSHDDEKCLSTHPQPCAPAGCSSEQHPTHDAPFRCLGYDCDAPGLPHGTPESRCGCPDFAK